LRRCSDPNLDLVPDTALAPPEVHIDAAQIAANEMELAQVGRPTHSFAFGHAGQRPPFRVVTAIRIDSRSPQANEVPLPPDDDDE
jgi:hypothetical protein